MVGHGLKCRSYVKEGGALEKFEGDDNAVELDLESVDGDGTESREADESYNPSPWRRRNFTRQRGKGNLDNDYGRNHRNGTSKGKNQGTQLETQK